MTSRRDRPAAAGPGRVPLWRSFAFRLGAGFAVAAIAAAGITAVVVNAAFAARFSQYLAGQQHAQLTAVSAALSRAYAGNGKWDPRALAAVVPAAGSGSVRVLTPSGHDVWQWDGHSMSWNDQWMQGSSSQPGGSKAGKGGSGSGSSGQGSSGHGGSCGSGWDSCGSWGSGSWDNSYSGGSGGRAGAVRLMAATPSPSPAATPALEPAQRVTITVNGKAVGTALVRLPQVTALPAAVAFRGEVIALVLAAGAAGALAAAGLGVVYARRAARPVRDAAAAARALAAGDRDTRLDAGRADEFGQMGAAFNALADAAEDQEKLRQGFAAEVAHELRTPLTILRSQVEGLQVGVLDPTPEALTSLDEEVRRMSRLVADLQILGSADAAGFSLERAPVDLAALAEETAREFAGLFEGAGVRLVTRLEPVTAWADRGRVGQILANLLSNALKFTPAGGLARLEVTADGTWALIRVSDSGPGIPADELPHIFDRFFRGRTARPAGSGIGLTVVAELAAAHGGTAGAASQPGHGATFTVRLPAQTAPPRNRFQTGSSQPLPTVKT